VGTYPKQRLDSLHREPDLPKPVTASSLLPFCRTFFNAALARNGIERGICLAALACGLRERFCRIDGPLDPLPRRWVSYLV